MVVFFLWLLQAGENKIGTNTSVFNAILASRSPPHLKAVFEQYKNISQMDIEGAIKDETSGNLCKAFLAVGMGLSAFFNYLFAIFNR